MLNSIVRIGVWNDLLLGDKVFLGQVNLSISTLQTPLEHKGWYWLRARPLTPATPTSKTDLGSLRIKIQYRKDLIYPLAAYEPLEQLLLRDLESPVSGPFRVMTLYPLCDPR